MRLIDADAALNDLFGSQCGCRIGDCGLEEPCEKARCILLQPTIEAEPVRHGQWAVLPTDDADTICSECGGVSPNGWHWKYCPHCGAKMNGGAENGWKFPI